MIETSDGIEPLIDVGLELTTDCNLSCVHCWQRDKRYPKMLALSDIRSTIKHLVNFKVSCLRITGGEPLVHPNFWEIMNEVSRNSISIILRTNGTLVDEAVAHRLQDYPIVFIEISVDGSKPHIHDGFRRKRGSLQKTLSALEMLIANGIQTRVKTVIHRNNVRDLLDLGQLLAGSYSSIEMWSLVDLVPLGNTAHYYQGLMPKPSDVIKAMRSLGRWIRQQHITLKIAGNALQLVTAQEEAIEANRLLKSPCDYRKGYLYICADGSVKKCAWLSDSLGNISEGVDQIWRSNCHQSNVPIPAECVQCEFFKKRICGYLYYVCPGIPCFPERKEFFRLLLESI